MALALGVGDAALIETKTASPFADWATGMGRRDDFWENDRQFLDVDQFGIMGHLCVERNRLLTRRSASAPNPTPIFVFKPQASLRKVKNCQLCRRKHDLSILETELRTLARLKDPISHAVFVTVVERTKRRNINTLLLRASCHGRKAVICFDA